MYIVAAVHFLADDHIQLISVVTITAMRQLPLERYVCQQVFFAP